MDATVALPVFPPKQFTLVCALKLAARAALGCVMVTLFVEVHPRSSVMVHVHVPAGRLVAAAVVCTGVVFQLYVYGAVPPVMEIVALPVLLPKQFTLVCAATVGVSAVVGCVMGTGRVVVHPRASVMVQVQVPAGRLFAVALVCAGLVFQLKAYGVVPPVTSTVALPVFPPKQFTLVCAPVDALNAAAGWVMVTVRMVVQPRASVTVQVHVPATRLVAVEAVCTGVVFHP